MIYAVSDLHIGSGHEDSEALAQFIDMIEPESTVWCVGDTWEYLLVGDDIMHSEGFDLILGAEESKSIIWRFIEGNHDPLGLLLEDFGTKRCGVLGGEIERVVMLHGHQFDFIWDERHEQWLWWKLKRLLKIASETPWAEKMANKDDEYVNHIGMIHAREIRWVQHSPYQQLVGGHTHYPVTIRLSDGKEVLDLGDLTLGSRTYAELVDGKFVLKVLEG